MEPDNPSLSSQEPARHHCLSIVSCVVFTPLCLQILGCRVSMVGCWTTVCNLYFQTEGNCILRREVSLHGV